MSGGWDVFTCQEAGFTAGFTLMLSHVRPQSNKCRRQEHTETLCKRQDVTVHVYPDKLSYSRPSQWKPKRNKRKRQRYSLDQQWHHASPGSQETYVHRIRGIERCEVCLTARPLSSLDRPLAGSFCSRWLPLMVVSSPPSSSSKSASRLSKPSAVLLSASCRMSSFVTSSPPKSRLYLPLASWGTWPSSTLCACLRPDGLCRLLSTRCR